MDTLVAEAFRVYIHTDIVGATRHRLKTSAHLRKFQACGWRESALISALDVAYLSSQKFFEDFHGLFGVLGGELKRNVGG